MLKWRTNDGPIVVIGSFYHFQQCANVRYGYGVGGKETGGLVFVCHAKRILIALITKSKRVKSKF